MAQVSARRAALNALRAWRTETRFADSIISKLLAQTDLSASDRAFALELFYGVLRNLTLLDSWIDCLRPSAIEVDLRDILRLGVYQLYCLKTPEHAAVNESVELASKRGRALINGVLRTAVRRQHELRDRAKAQPLFIRYSHPQFLVARWQHNFGAQAAESLCAWNNKPPPVYGRINQLKIDPEEFLRSYPNSVSLTRTTLGETESFPAPEARREGASFPYTFHTTNFVEFHTFPSKALERGHCYIQDPSTALACCLLDPQPGERVLDACAAPGGKTAYIAELMKNCGTILACDRNPERNTILKDNLARLDVKIANVALCDWEHDRGEEEILSARPFDRILVDAPCTNSGVMRRRVDLRWRLQPADFQRMQARQIEIIRAVFPLLKPGGVLVYSTCSLEPEENDEVVRRALSEMPILRLEDKQSLLPFRDKFDGAFAAKLVNS